MMDPTNSARADKWLWATRFYKTRSLAAKACAAGKVKRAGQLVKAATDLRPGDTLEIPFPEGPGMRTIVVKQAISLRVGAPEARLAYEETTDPAIHDALKAWQTARKEAGGRPTKQQRREIGRIRGFFE